MDFGQEYPDVIDATTYDPFEEDWQSVGDKNGEERLLVEPFKGIIADPGDNSEDLYIIGAVCLWVTNVIILLIPPKVPINRRNCVSPISRHFSKDF